MSASKEELLFHLALTKPPAERRLWLERECAGDSTLRARVEALLDENQQTISAGPKSNVFGNSGAPDRAGESDERIGHMLGRYKLLERIGEGGYGVVYVAEQTEPVRRRVALKVIKLGMDTKAVVARFEAERQALAMMDHPNIARVLDAGSTEAGRPFFVMELVRGIRITEYCDQNQLPNKERLDLFIKVCQAIQHAHQKGIIHRDIKPSNILVTLHDGVPVPKVIDFGIAKATEGRLTEATVYTQLHQFIGTPAYMSPEQAEMSGLDVDTRSDIYSLGVLLYELLTGRTPFEAKELMSLGLDAMRKTIREKEPVRPSTKLATLEGEERTTTARRHALEMPRLIYQLKGDLDWIVMKCLEKDRTRRYDTANGLGMDLKRHLNNELVVARPPSAAYRFQKAFRRNKLVFASGAAIGLALLAAVSFSGWSFLREREARMSEENQRYKAEAQRKLAEAAQSEATRQRDLAQDRLLESLIREMHSISTIRPAGYRAVLRDRVRQALELPRSATRHDKLRAEFAQALGDPLGFEPVVASWERGALLDYNHPLALSSDGQLAAVWTTEYGLEIRQTSTGQRVANLEVGGFVYALAFSPDAQKLYGDIRRRALPVETREWPRRSDGSWNPVSRQVESVSGLLTAPDGVFALQREAGEDGQFGLIDLDTHKRLGTLSFPEQKIPNALGVAPGRGLIAVGRDVDRYGLSRAVEVFDLNNPKPRARLEASPGQGALVTASFSSNGRFLACAGESGVVVYETSEFKTVSRSLSYLGAGVAFAGDGGTLALPFTQQTGIRLLDLNSGGEFFLNTREPTRDLVSSANGTTLMINHPSGITFFRLADAPERRHFRGHAGGVPAVEFSPDGHLLASTGKDGSIRFWEAETGRPRKVIQRPGATGQSVAFSPDGRWLATADYYNTQVLIWSVATGEQLMALGESRAGGGQTWGCAFSPDGHRLVAVGISGLRIWDLAPPTNTANEASLDAHLLVNEPGVFRNLVFQPGGRSFAFMGTTNRADDARIFVRGLGPHDPIEALSAPTSFLVQSLGVVPGNGEFVQASWPSPTEGLLHFYDPVTRQLTRTIPTLAPGESQTGGAGNQRASPDSSRLAIANHAGRRVNLYDQASGRRLYSLPDEPGTIWWLAWHPTSKQLAVTRDNGDISLWNLPKLEAALAEAGLPP